MRLLGYALILVAFAAMTLKVLQVRDVTLEVTARCVQRIPEKAAYERGDVKTAVFHASRETWSAAVPGLHKWAILMIVGAVVLDLSGRRRVSNHVTGANSR